MYIDNRIKGCKCSLFYNITNMCTCVLSKTLEITMHRYVIMCIIGMINKYNFFLVAVSVKPCDIKSIYRYI